MLEMKTKENKDRLGTVEKLIPNEEKITQSYLGKDRTSSKRGKRAIKKKGKVEATREKVPSVIRRYHRKTFLKETSCMKEKICPRWPYQKGKPAREMGEKIGTPFAHFRRGANSAEGPKRQRCKKKQRGKGLKEI